MMELSSLFSRLGDVVERMPEQFTTYDLVQRFAHLYPADYFAAGHELAQQTPQEALKVLHQGIGQWLSSSDRVIEGAHLPCVTPWGERSSSPRWHRKH